MSIISFSMRKLKPITWQYIDTVIKTYSQNSSKQFYKRKKHFSFFFFFHFFFLKSSIFAGNTSIAAQYKECSFHLSCFLTVQSLNDSALLLLLHAIGSILPQQLIFQLFPTNCILYCSPMDGSRHL